MHGAWCNVLAIARRGTCMHACLGSNAWPCAVMLISRWIYARLITCFRGIPNGALPLPGRHQQHERHGALTPFYRACLLSRTVELCMSGCASLTISPHCAPNVRRLLAAQSLPESVYRLLCHLGDYPRPPAACTAWSPRSSTASSPSTSCWTRSAGCCRWALSGRGPAHADVRARAYEGCR